VTGTPVSISTPYVYSIGQGWNQVGTPFNKNFNWSSIQIVKSGTTYTLDDAVSAAIIARYPFYYDGYQWLMLSEGQSLTPGTGYMAYAYESGASLSYDYNAGAGRMLGRVIKKPPAFHIKISATGERSADPDNFIGLALNSADQFDGEDIVEPPAAFGQYYTTLYFPHDQWSRHPGRYARDFRSVTGVDVQCPVQPESQTCKVWDFNVSTNETGTTMTLSWGSLAEYAGKYEITLTDLVTGANVDMIANDHYTYTTSGGAHSFKITVVMLGAGLQTMTHTLRPGWNLISVPLEPMITDALEQLGDDLEMFNVYQYFDGNFYTARDPEGVDIQAGIGYWIYVGDNTEIDLVGIAPVPSVGVTVPLKPGWNLIGNPFDRNLVWNDEIRITCGGESRTLSGGISSGWIDGALYQYNENGVYTRIEPGGLLTPWRGYFLRASGDCEIELKTNQ